MNGKFCKVENKETKETTSAFIYAQKPDPSAAGRTIYYGLKTDDQSIHLDYVVHSITAEALGGYASIQTIEECISDALADLGGTFDVSPYLCSFTSTDYKVTVDPIKDEYWMFEEEDSSEEEYGSY